jgi:hypothetical protein
VHKYTNESCCWKGKKGEGYSDWKPALQQPFKIAKISTALIRGKSSELGSFNL